MNLEARMSKNAATRLRAKIEDGSAKVGVIGLGYVGLPLAMEISDAGHRTLGIDLNENLVERINRGESHINDVPSERLARILEMGMFEATSDLSRLEECDVISICVPTPLNKIKDPDLSYVLAAGQAVAHALRPGQLIILESTTFPGTTREVLLPVLQEQGLVVGEDFFVCFSPERVDPGNPVWHTRNTPKVIGGVTEACLAAGTSIYERIFDTLVPVGSAEAAELVKVYENTFRMINIALANELAQACDKLGVDVWEVIEAAGTKPFGFMKFTPGPGLGGHCIPLDPHYLSWKMRTLAYKTRMIEMASEINGEMPGFVVRKVGSALNSERKSVNGSRILVLGIAYKRDIDDLRESPALGIIEMLKADGAEVSYSDPHCPTILDDGHTPIPGLPMHSVRIDPSTLAGYDAVVIVTDHSAFDYQMIADYARLVIDTRGVMRRLSGSATVVGLSTEATASKGSPAGLYATAV